MDGFEVEPPGGPFEGFLKHRISRGQMLKALGGTLFAGLASRFTISTADASELPYVVLIVLDGARPEYFSVPNIPHIRKLMDEGTQYTNAFAGILESETPSGHTAITTGHEPRDNGVLSFSWGRDDVRVDLFNPQVIRGGAMERIVRKAGVPTIAELVHSVDRNAAVVAVSGSKYYAADAIGGPDADVIMYYQGQADDVFAPTFIPGHQPPPGILNRRDLKGKNGSPLGIENHLAMKLAIRTFKKMHQRVSLINLPEFDWPLGHVDGGILDRTGVVTLMQSFDRDLGFLKDALRNAGVLDRTIFVLAADHGMMPLRAKVDKGVIVTPPSQEGIGFVAQSYNSASNLWAKDSGSSRQAASLVADQRNPHIQSVYVKTHGRSGYGYDRVTDASLLRATHAELANQYLLRSFAGPNGPDVAILFREGTGCEPNGQSGWKADHGGVSWHAQHIPLIFSGPGVRRGAVSSSPARLIDIAPTLLHLMGVPRKRMKGIVLADALAGAPRWAWQWQAGMNKSLYPVVEALKTESKHDLG